MSKVKVATAAELARARRTRLAAACVDLDPAEERALADEGLAADTAASPPY